MRKIHLSTNDLLHLAGLEKRSSFWSRSLPIAAGVGAGLVAGAVVSIALLTPARRERLTEGVKGLWKGRAAKSPFVPPLHTDAPGSDFSHEVHDNAPAAHA
jgi:hypothetical protein